MSAVITNPSTGTPLPTPNTLMSRDSNANTAINNLRQGYANTLVTGVTTTLTVASEYAQFYLGSGGSDTVKLPVVSTLVRGFSFLLVNKSSFLLAVNSSGNDLIVNLNPEEWAIFECEKISGTDASSWTFAKMYAPYAGFKLLDSTNVVAFDGDLRRLIAGDGTTVPVDWISTSDLTLFGILHIYDDNSIELSKLLSPGTSPSVDVENRKLIASDGSTVNFDYSDPNGSTGNFKDDSSVPTTPIIPAALAVAPAGYIKITVGGVDSWLPYYQ